MELVKYMFGGREIYAVERVKANIPRRELSWGSEGTARKPERLEQREQGEKQREIRSDLVVGYKEWRTNHEHHIFGFHSECDGKPW